METFSRAAVDYLYKQHYCVVAEIHSSSFSTYIFVRRSTQFHDSPKRAVCGEVCSVLEAQHKSQRETNVRFIQPPQSRADRFNT